MAAKDEEELDPREGPLHPRHRTTLIGHDEPQNHLLEACKSGRFHHAWLVSGPQGIGKATLAYRVARYLLRHPDPQTAPADSLAVPQADPVASQIDARSHPDLLVVERAVEKGKLKSGISVEASRKASTFFGKTAAAGGWRVAIIDAADDMNNAAANSVLKTLEEPPEKSVFILVCHQRGKLLPTIRSRCIELALNTLEEADVASVLKALPGGAGRQALSHVPLAAGRPGLALSLADTGAGAIFERFVNAAEAGRLDMQTRMMIAKALYGRGTDDRFAVFCSLLDGWLTSRAGNAVRLAQTVPVGQALARAHETIGHSIRQTNALNLDRRLTILQAFDLIEKAQRA